MIIIIMKLEIAGKIYLNRLSVETMSSYMKSILDLTIKGALRFRLVKFTHFMEVFLLCCGTLCCS